MKWSWFGRAAMALFSALALGLGMTACGGGTIAYMWVIGQQFSQITGFKIDDFTGNLTAIQNSPFSANGSKPVYLVVKSGGRYLYVVNQGATSTPTANSSDSGIAAFAVGGDGALTYEGTYPTQGFMHQWIQFDSTGNYLFALDEYSASGDGQGAITTFSADPNTGRLLVVPQTAATPPNGAAPLYLEVGHTPLSMTTSGACLFTVNQGDQTVTPYVSNSGQLSVATTGNINITNAVHLTSITSNGTYLVLTDAGQSTTTNGVTSYLTPGTIYVYTVGTTGSSTCGLTSITGGGVPNTAGVTDPTYALIAQSNNYVFALNSSSAVTNPATPFSQISAFDIVTNQLSPVPGEPFATGSGPVCIVEDPTQKYMYVSNHGGTITGYDFDNTRGALSNLQRGSSFTVNDNSLGCLALSGSVD